jgi:2-polyprenyl-3-methyl-5-hydroxy-6-metoxy-1,4-benzoquinol methylase
MIETNWLDVWNRVSISTRHTEEKQKVSRGRNHFRKDSPERPDPLLDYVLQNLNSRQTFMDIGAGSGRWTIPAAKIVRSATAIEPSDSMLEMLRERISREKLDNISIIQARWEEASIEPHDIIACTHAIYETTDFAAFVRKMEQNARHRCYLVLRLPPYDGIIGELSLKIYGHPYDSPNAIIAYNALYSLGIYANVVMENNMHNWTDATFEEAFFRAKRHLNLESSSTEYDELIRGTLKRRLTLADGHYIWPDGMRSALLWWDTLKKNVV